MKKTNVISYKEVIGPAFYRAWNDFLRGWYIDRDYGKMDLREQVFAGGRGSLKSSAASIFILLGLERDAMDAAKRRRMGDPKWKSYLTHAICFRKVGSDLATSVFSQFEWAITKLNLADKYALTKSPLKIVRRDTGQVIYFRGLDDPTKVKSIKAPGLGYFRYLWCEELDQFDGMEEIRSVRQSVLRGGHKFQSFYTYNPPETTANWVNDEMSRDTPGRLVYRSNYLMVPQDWLGEGFFTEANLLRERNERAWRHEYLGEVTGNGGSVFPNIEVREITDEELRRYDRLYLGLDFGFSLDPTAFVALYHGTAHDNLVFFDEIYKYGLRNVELAEMIKKLPYVSFNYIMCDSAEPKSIADLEAYGINALPVSKVERRFGFKWMQSRNKIVIDPRRTPNVHREFSRAEYGKTRSGQFISRYPEVDDHSIDAARYAVSDLTAGAGLF